MLWGGRWEGGSCLGTHVRIKDFKIKKKKKNLPAMQQGDPTSSPGSGRSPGEGKVYPLLYSGLENSMDGGAWQATVCVVAKSDMNH